MRTYPLFRLLWRRGVLSDLAVATSFAIGLSLLGAKAGIKLFGSLANFDGDYIASESLNLHACLLLGAVIGVVSNFALQDLLYNRFSWGLPNLGKLLRSGMWQLALIVAVFSGICGEVLAVIDRGSGFIQGAALGLLGFALGNQQWDPKIGRNFCFVFQAILLFMVLGAEHIAAWIGQSPWLLPPLALAFALISVKRSTQRNGLRQRALVPIDQLGVSFDPAGRAEANTEAKKNFRNGNPLWKYGLIQHQSDRLRALYYEQYGWARGEWLGLTLRYALAMALALSALFFGAYFLVGKDGQGLTHSISSAALVGPMMFLLFAKTDLRRGVLYPMSRQQRSDILWRASLWKGASALFITVVMLLVPPTLIRTLREWQVVLENTQLLLAAVVVLAVFAPIAQWCRLRWIDSKQRSANSPSFALMFSLLLIVYMVLVNFLAVILRKADSSAVTASTWIALPFLLFGAQLLFRRKLRTLFATTDLT